MGGVFKVLWATALMFVVNKHGFGRRAVAQLEVKVSCVPVSHRAFVQAMDVSSGTSAEVAMRIIEARIQARVDDETLARYLRSSPL